jgi:hypothetical protein
MPMLMTPTLNHLLNNWDYEDRGSRLLNLKKDAASSAETDVPLKRFGKNSVSVATKIATSQILHFTHGSCGLIRTTSLQ